jgi:hypothetical protein
MRIGPTPGRRPDPAPAENLVRGRSRCPDGADARCRCIRTAAVRGVGGPVPDQRAVEQLTAAGLHPPLHHRVHPRHLDAAEHDLDPGVGEDLVEQVGELPVPVPVRIMNRDRPPASSRSITKFFAACVTQDAVGCAAVPRTLILRLACSITANAYSLAPDRVTVSKKSHASSASAWERRNAAPHAWAGNARRAGVALPIAP